MAANGENCKRKTNTLPIKSYFFRPQRDMCVLQQDLRCCCNKIDTSFDLDIVAREAVGILRNSHRPGKCTRFRNVRFSFAGA